MEISSKGNGGIGMVHCLFTIEWSLCNLRKHSINSEIKPGYGGISIMLFNNLNLYVDIVQYKTRWCQGDTCKYKDWLMCKQSNEAYDT